MVFIVFSFPVQYGLLVDFRVFPGVNGLFRHMTRLLSKTKKAVQIENLSTCTVLILRMLHYE